MFRRELLRLLATPLAGWLRPWIPLTAFSGDVSQESNAATIYQEAFGWAQTLTPADTKRLCMVATIALDDRRLDGLIQQAGPALVAIRKAAGMCRCDWGMEIRSCDDLANGRLSVSSVNVIRIACLSARWHAELGEGRKAIDDVFAGLTLAHRIGTGGLTFARLLECGSEVPAFQTLGRILTGLDSASLDDLSRRLAMLPPPEPASAAIGPESRFMLETLRRELMKLGPVIEDEDWSQLGFGVEETVTVKRLTGGDRARLLAHLESTGPAFTELARRLDLPRPGCRAALDDFARAERSAFPVVAMLVEQGWGVRHVVDRMRALRAMLRAGLVLVRDGEASFRTVSDPFGSGPFGLERRKRLFDPFGNERPREAQCDAFDRRCSLMSGCEQRTRRCIVDWRRVGDREVRRRDISPSVEREEFMDSIKAVVETAIYVCDLDAAEQFYRDVLGLEVIGKEAGRHVFFRVGDGVLLAFNAEATLKGDVLPSHGASGPGHCALGIRPEDLDEWRRAARKPRDCHREGGPVAKRRSVPLLPGHRRQLDRTHHTGCLGTAVRLVSNETKAPVATHCFQICAQCLRSTAALSVGEHARKLS